MSDKADRGGGAASPAYNRPSAFLVRIVNPLAIRFGFWGAVTVTVPGRRTGVPRSVPLNVVEVDGVRYLVSTLGETEWARNIRAAGRVTITRRGRSEDLAAQLVPVPQRGPVLRAYRAMLGRSVDRYFDQLPDDADHPVFELRRSPVSEGYS